MRIIGQFPDQRQVSAFVDSMRVVGFDRKDMIISNLADESKFNNLLEAADDMTFIKTERDGLGEFQTFSKGIKGFENKEGIAVAAEVPRHAVDRVRVMMIQSGAQEVIQD